MNEIRAAVHDVARTPPTHGHLPARRDRRVASAGTPSGEPRPPLCTAAADGLRARGLSLMG
ncbi:hypothetical protein T492DRAFT_921050 [Pavlovales sp. CCMP2436]|nr:hypothetical protein T492DRAFT_921050 [Pavlovales sp. CCMP2436]